MNFPERRKYERFRGEFPIKLRFGMGMTRDCSIEGMYFVANGTFSVGEHIGFVMILEESSFGQSLRLSCRGKVLRVEPNFLDKTGVAVSFTINGFERSMTNGKENHPTES